MAVSFIETDKNNENGLEALKFHPKLNLVQDAFKDIYGNLSDERKSLWATVSRGIQQYWSNVCRKLMSKVVQC